MPVDVMIAIEIARPRAEVAAYAADPSNAPEWYGPGRCAGRTARTSPG